MNELIKLNDITKVKESIKENKEKWIFLFKNSNDILSKIDTKNFIKAIDKFLQSKKDCEDSRNDLWEVIEWADKKIGEDLIKMKEEGMIKQGGGKNQYVDSNEKVLSINNIGITKNESSQAQKKAKISDKEFEDIIEECKKENDTTKTSVLKRKKKKEKKQYKENGTMEEEKKEEKNWITLDEWNELSEKEQNEILNKDYSIDKKFNKVNENIEWAAWSWNPITGCQHECEYCYAHDLADRYYFQGFIPSIYPERFTMPKNTKISKPRQEGDIGYKAVFVCSMADLFGEWVPQEWINKVIETIKEYNEWIYIFLTKNPKRLIDIEWPDNAWIGATVDKQKRVKRTEKYLKQIKAKVKFISCEPLTEEIVFNDLSMIDWIIIGGYSDRTQCKNIKWEWIEKILFKAREHNCKVYFKPNLEVRPQEYPK